MTKLTKNDYLTPEVEVIAVAVEEGICNSGSTTPEYKEDDDVIVIGQLQSLNLFIHQTIMRKLFWSVLCVTALFASCAEADIEVRPVMGGEDFTATIAETRAELDGVAVLWNDADELTIFTKTAHNRHYKVKSLSNGNRSATFGYVGFSGNDGSAIENNYAVYPYDADATLAGEIITTKINAEQVYNAEKVDLSNALMAAKSTSSALQFVNSTALMRFDVANNMPDSYTLSSIKLVSAANKIAGEATINLSTDSKAVVTENGVNEVTLSGIDTPITAEKQAFYVVLPATSFAAKDLTVTFTYAEGVEKSFALPAFDLELGSIKTIAYTINEGEDFEGSTPDSGDDFEGETPGTSDANKIITYKAPEQIVKSWNESTFGAPIVSHEFDSETMLGTITFDDVVTTIGAEAFYAKTLVEITIPNTVTSIGDSAFAFTILQSVVIPDSVISIGNNAFEGTNLKSITIPDSVTSLGDYAFSQCNKLTNATIGKGLKTVGSNPFSSCSSLTKFNGEFVDESGVNLIVNGTLVSVAPGEISGQYTFPDGITAIGDYLFYGQNGITSVVIPDSVTSIGSYVFQSCVNIESITIGNGVKTIGECAFIDSQSLKSIVIPDSVTTIGMRAFFQCVDVTTITIGSSVTYIGEYAFRINDINDIIESVYCRATTPPTCGLNQIFSSNNDFTLYVPYESLEAYVIEPWSNYVTKPLFVNTPANNEIWYTTDNNQVVTPKDVFNTTIKSNTYENGMGVITFNEDLTSIGYEAFKSILTIESVVIPASVTLIDGDAFYGCNSLYDVYCLPTTPPACRYGAFPVYSTIYVPSASVSAYKSAPEYWTDYTNKIVGYDF